MNTLYIIALVCVGIGSIGAIALTIIQSIGSTNDKNEIINTTKSENQVLKNSLNNLKRERDELNKILEKRDAKIQEQTNYIINLNEKLASKSDYIQNYLTGGNGYPFLNTTFINRSDGDPKFLIFHIQNNFAYPLYNVSCLVIDFNLIDQKTYKKKNSTETFIKKNDFDSSLLVNTTYNEIPSKVKPIIDKQIPIQERRLRVSLHSRNKSVIQKIAFVIVDNELNYGWQILDMDYKILKQSDMTGMPVKVQKELIKSLTSIPSKITLVIE